MSVSVVLNSLDLIKLILKFKKKIVQRGYIENNYKTNKEKLILELKYINGDYDCSDTISCENCNKMFSFRLSRNDKRNINMCIKYIINLYMKNLYC